MDKNEDEIRRLSLTARMILCLINFEVFCVNNGIESSEVDKLIEYLWKWPRINGPDEFDPWIKSPPILVDFALGHGLHKSVATVLVEKGVDEQRFRNIVEGLVEIVWGSFWGASEDLLSYNAYQKSVSATKNDTLPPLTPFKFSQFRDNDGWGEKPSSKDYEYWQSLRPSA